jgi:hypothetical protein
MALTTLEKSLCAFLAMQNLIVNIRHKILGSRIRIISIKSEQNFFVFEGNDPVVATRALIGIFGIEMVPLKVSLIS